MNTKINLQDLLVYLTSLKTFMKSHMAHSFLCFSFFLSCFLALFLPSFLHSFKIYTTKRSYAAGTYNHINFYSYYYH